MIFYWLNLVILRLSLGGKWFFNATLELMKDKVRSRREMYRYGGLPLAFQCWFYECCPYTRKKLTYRIGDLVPRILNWTVKKKVTFKRLRKEFFLLSREQVKKYFCLVYNILLQYPDDFGPLVQKI